jgi:hypothetical protein
MAKKNTRARFRLKFVGVVWMSERVAETPKFS